jgi:putative FmdB family regulatory protein
MPTYEYECAACGVVELFQPITAAPRRSCPHCGGRRFRRLISGGGGIIFKGEGFWETDYNRSDDYRRKAEKETVKPSASGTDTAAPTPAKDVAQTKEPSKEVTGKPVAKTAKPEIDLRQKSSGRSRIRSKRSVGGSGSR